MKDKFLEHARREYSPKQRIVGLMFLTPIFLLILPFLFIWLGARLDGWLLLPVILDTPFNWILGCLLILPGLFFGIWSNYVQLIIPKSVMAW